MQIIPTTSAGARTVAVDLDNDAGLLQYRTYWNGVTGTWNLDILDQEDSPYLEGIALIIRNNLVSQYPQLEDVVQDLRVIDLNGENNRLDSSLGVTSKFVHFDLGEHESLSPAQDELKEIVNVNLDDILQ